ncbi:MAG: AAA family ATPase [Candidatus Aenigmatarchaeota archaeon]|nr:MAG: AAA family ATPase [Candidatus Aenigmarchaeota archaeon]
MITKLTLKGWRSHWDSTLEFSEGTNALIGVMGSGKSSVLDAISFALFGTFPALSARRLVLEDVIMKRPQKRAEAEVRLEFEWNGVAYEIMRRIDRDGRRVAEIRKEGRLLDSGVTKVTDVVERVLHTNYDLFSRAVYAEQNGLDYFLTLQKGQRMKRIDALLRIDRFEAARSTCTTVLNRIRDSVRDKSAFVREMESGDGMRRVDGIESEMRELDGKRRNLKLKEMEIATATNKMEEEIQNVRKKEVEIRSLDVEKSRLLGSIRILETDAVDVRADVLAEKKKLLAEGMPHIQKQKETRDRKLRDLTNMRQRFEMAIEEAARRIEALKSAGAVCPTCEQPIDEAHRSAHVVEKEAHIKELRGNIEHALKHQADAEKELAESSELMESCREELHELDKRIALCEQAATKRKLLEENTRKLSVLEVRMAEMRAAMDGVSTDGLQDRLRVSSSALASLRTELRGVENVLIDRTNELARLRERQALFDKHREQIQKMESLADDLRKFQSALEETQTALRREFVVAVNATMSQLWETLYPYEDYIDVRLGVSDDYTLELKENAGDWVPVEGVASGGERTTALLALRMAFALVLAPNLRWLVLDEPTHNLDANAVEQLAEVLRDRIGEYVDQVFLITHDEKLEDAVTGYLYRLEREREKNEPTRVVRVMNPTTV